MVVSIVNVLNAVVPLLHQYLSSCASSVDMSDQALRCFSSWAQFGLPLPDSEPVIELAFTALRAESHFDVAVESLISVFSHPDNHRSVTHFHSCPAHVDQWSNHLGAMCSRA